MYISNLTKLISALIAVMTFVGLALHDTKLDSMTSFAIAVPVAAASYEGSAMLLAHEAHTHVERVSVDNIAGRYISQLPKLGQNDEKKYRLSRAATKSGHQTEGFLTPLAC